ncbi:unnamed protein product, partial [Brachionus calyciflorus]
KVKSDENTSHKDSIQDVDNITVVKEARGEYGELKKIASVSGYKNSDKEDLKIEIKNSIKEGLSFHEVDESSTAENESDLNNLELNDMVVKTNEENHCEAVEFINSLMNFRGRQLVAKLNDIRSEDGQWFRSNNRLKLFDNQRLYYHEEKTKYVKKQNDIIDGRESITIQELRAELAAEKLGREEDQQQLVIVKEKLSKANRRIKELLVQNERFQSA